MDQKCKLKKYIVFCLFLNDRSAKVSRVWLVVVVYSYRCVFHHLNSDQI